MFLVMWSDPGVSSNTCMISHPIDLQAILYIYLAIFQDFNSLRGQEPGSSLARQGLQHIAEGFGHHIQLLGLHPESRQSQGGWLRHAITALGYSFRSLGQIGGSSGLSQYGTKYYKSKRDGGEQLMKITLFFTL